MKYLLIAFIIASAQNCNQASSHKPSAKLLTLTELKLKLVDSLGEVDYCDRDEYPVARPTLEPLLSQKFFDTISASNSEEFRAIIAHIGLTGTTTFNNDEKLMVYREHKALMWVKLDSSIVKYAFDVNIKTAAGPEWHYEGTITPSGQIIITVKKSFHINCPICLPFNTMIETPHGEVEVDQLKKGDEVTTTDTSGKLYTTTILATGKTQVPPDHKMIHFVLDDGREFTASFGHPLASGSPLSTIKQGDLVQNATVITVDTITYKGGYTYDILPKGPTGFYLVNGIIIGSTLKNNTAFDSEKPFSHKVL